MIVEYRRTAPPAPANKIAELDSQLPGVLPEDYRAYLRHQDGGRLTSNDEAIKEIFGVGDVPDHASIWAKLEVYEGRVPTWLVPVASDAFGNLFCLSLRGTDHGSVWFWDHEGEPEDDDDTPTEENLTFKARSWQEFLDRLQPFQLEE
ncbi:SMI1/KNR4 family protein [Longispora sp. NPDC051575]|uniref:SMI1/KNR4 family protein n=1 Tax=Longispora sp. NPDC051575 TaxID=3154943 RepID=UPI003423A8A3